MLSMECLLSQQSDNIAGYKVNAPVNHLVFHFSRLYTHTDMSKPLRRPIAGPKRALGGSSLQVRKTLPGAKGGAKADEGYLYVAGVRDASQRVSEYRVGCHPLPTYMLSLSDHIQAENDICPVCHTDRQFNKNLRLLVSPCYHKM